VPAAKLSEKLILLQPDKAAAAILRGGGGGRGISFCKERAHTAPHCAENVQIQRAQCPPSPAETTVKAYKVLSEKKRTEWERFVDTIYFRCSVGIVFVPHSRKKPVRTI
jgi:hypothetical protein